MRVAGLVVVACAVAAFAGPGSGPALEPTPASVGPSGGTALVGPTGRAALAGPGGGPALFGATGTTASAPERATTAGPASPTPAFVLPVPPPAVVLTPFRPPAQRYGTGHRGVDLAAPAGTVVRATADGTVVYAGMLAGRGVVSIEHESGLRTTYEPVTASVTAGEWVTAGQAIGTAVAGHPSCAPADCLHWGARLPDGSYLDPMALLRPWRVRLLPWDGPG